MKLKVKLEHNISNSICSTFWNENEYRAFHNRPLTNNRTLIEILVSSVWVQGINASREKRKKQRERLDGAGVNKEESVKEMMKKK